MMMIRLLLLNCSIFAILFFVIFIFLSSDVRHPVAAFACDFVAVSCVCVVVFRVIIAAVLCTYCIVFVTQYSFLCMCGSLIV